jgi:dolichol-phosphate mannosyltransferase
MDADGQHPADRVDELVDELVLGADLVVGSRHVDGGEIDGWPWSRKVTSKVATLLARAFVVPAREITDPMSGFFAVDRETFDDDVLDLADPHGYKIFLELAALVPDAEIAEVPITFRARQAGESNLTLDEQIRFVEHIVGLWFLIAGLDQRVTPPLLVRSIEAASVVAVALAMLNVGLILGDVDGALGAGLIAAAGGTIVLGAQRLARTGTSWTSTNEVFAK